MIRPRKHLEPIRRDLQSWGARGQSLRLDMNELVPHLDEQVFADLVSSLQPWMITAYPEVNPVYEALTESLGLSREHFLLTSGSDAGIRTVIEAFCDPGDTLIITYPTYGMYEVYAQIYNLGCIKVFHRPDFSLDTKEILNALDERAKLIAIANPNGAIGCVIPQEELQVIIRQASANGTVVLLDEAYLHYYEDHWTQQIDEYDNLVLVRTFSKAGGLAGLRFGYLLSNPALREWLFKIKPVVEINSLSALFGSHLLRNLQIIEGAVAASLDGKDYLIKRLRDAYFETYSGYTNFIQVKFGPFKEAIHAGLKQRNILVKDQSGSELLHDYTRITIGPRREMDMLLEAIFAVLPETLKQ